MMLNPFFQWSRSFIEIPGPQTVRLLFRLMLSGIFLVAGAGHLHHPQHVVERLLQSPNGPLAAHLMEPRLAVLASGLFLLLGGLSLFLGLHTRLAALVLFALIVPITFAVQIGSLATLGPLFKNIGLSGGLLFFIFYGADAWSLDAKLNPRA